MKYSKLFGKTNKTAKQYDSKNATLLIKAGFIHQTMAGVYSMLPLGWRVMRKIEQIVREEMDKIGSEVLMPCLSPKALWKQAGRLDTVDILMKTAPANKIAEKEHNQEYILNCTHEEVATDITKDFYISYKDLPTAIYQINTKFRNESRAKSGLMRGREFRMKDLYSFHTSREDLNQYYEKVKKVYMQVYKRLGLGNLTYITAASGGMFTDDYSHEFQTKCETGEDLVFYVPSKDLAFNLEIAPSRAIDKKQDVDMKDLQKIFTKDITGMQQLVDFLKVSADKCVKTLIYSGDNGRIIVIAVRGDYDVNEIKLKKVVKTDKLELANSDIVKKVTGAEIGYAGIIDLPQDVELYCDDSIEHLINFECGANETNYHYINVNWGRDVHKPEIFYDIKQVKEGDLYPETGEVYEVFKASEVGNIFPLGTKYPDAFEYKFTDQNGELQSVWMGSYGIGITRLMGVIVEIFNDERGIIWPESIAPYQVYLVDLINDKSGFAKKIYNQLISKDIEVLWDDRNVSAGSKFADADLIGCPIRLVISSRNGKQIEWKKRGQQESKLLSIEDIITKLNVNLKPNLI